ncbi:MAG: nicotinamide mononucleotide transporter [Phycisphaerales bacterium]|nr:nicotinamide mononucleotide transporter [Phycisphaerales bacterium]
MSEWEIAANVVNTISILLAARNSIHTWWTGIVGCSLFAYVFLTAQLYADSTLQLFFIATSGIGWSMWLRGRVHPERPIRRTQLIPITLLACGAIAVTLLYGLLLHTLTDAFAPYFDSAVLAFSVLGQFLLMARRYEAWWCWLIVNTIAVPLFLSRGLNVTAVLYAGYWVNAIVALFHWRRLMARQ